MPLLVDEIDNPVWCTYGPAPNIAYLIATDGRIIAKQSWYAPKLMEQTIINYLEEPKGEENTQNVSSLPPSSGEPPPLSHTLEEYDSCLTCHSGNGIKPFPNDHNGRNKDVCTSCHKQL
jgi:hypothetical protein